MPEIIPATGICAGGLSSNVTEFGLVNTALNGLVVTAGATVVQATAMKTAMGALATATTAVALKLNTSLRGVAVGVKSTDANFNYNVNVNVLTARNALAGPTDQIPIPPPPTGL